MYKRTIFGIYPGYLGHVMGNADIMGYNLYNHTATPWDMVIPICILIRVDECILDLL